MDFKCRRRGAKDRAKHMWHKWLAWYPVRISHNKIVWLGHVQRKGKCYRSIEGDWWDWKYRPLHYKEQVSENDSIF